MRWLCAASRHRSGLAALCFVLLTWAGVAAYAQGTPAGTVVQNTATLAFNDSAGQPQPTVTSNAAAVTVSQVAAVQAAPATGASQGQAGQAVYYPVTVTNKSNGPDTLSLAAVSASSPAWTVAVYKDDGAGGGTANDGVHQSGETNLASSTGSLAADGSFKCFVAVTVPSGAQGGTVDTATLTSASQLDASKKASSVCSTTVKAAAVTLTKGVDKAQAAPGDTLRYTIGYSNTGDASATNVVLTDTIPSAVNYAANSVRVNGASRTDAADADEVAVAAGVITINLGTVAAGASGTVTFDAKVK